MAEVVLVPDIGDFTDIPVVEILVAVGDQVEVEGALVTLESDKATMDVPAPFAGTVAELLVKLGDTVSEGSPIARIETAEPADAPAAEPEEPKAESGTEPEARPETEPESGTEPDPQPESGTEPASPEPAADGPVYASPSARRLARERSIDLSTVTGSGRDGRITAEDLDDAPTAKPGAPTTPAAGAQRVPLTRIQQLSRDNLTRAWQTIPHVTHHDDADITELEAFRKQLNAEQSAVKITMVALLLKACAATLDEFPKFASSLDGDELIMKSARHIAFAADTPNGLVVPVVHDVDRKGLLELAGDLTALSAKAREGKLTPKEMSGAVFTISSLGGIGGTGFSPIVNPPQVAILGVVRSETKPVWDGAAFIPRLMLPLSLSYDHRVIDGAAAARFSVHLSKVLEDFRRVLL